MYKVSILSFRADGELPAMHTGSYEVDFLTLD